MKKSTRLLLVALLVGGSALIAAQLPAKTEEVMAETAVHFVQALTPEQKPNVVFDFDVEDRMVWHFVPDNSFESRNEYPRQGLTYKQFDPQQRRLADALLSSGLSRQGFVKATTIMSLEEILRIKENDTTGRRDVDRYHYSIFGTPSSVGTWGWRVEGHHLSLNYTLKDGRLVATAPTFLGANPHEVRQGPRKGLRPLGQEEDLARRLARSLTADQRHRAVVADVAYQDILTGADTRAKLENQPLGLALSQMNDRQVEMLMSLLEEYAHNMPAEVAAERMKRARSAPPDKLFFAWAGSIEPGKGDYYRVQGPTFLVEYDNTQNQNNHSHTVWRDLEGDFGRDVFAMHHRRYDHGHGVGQQEHLAPMKAD